jgi:diguanylate cyclase (GGDEF)-like protein/PAS domain S-box-containing protein
VGEDEELRAHPAYINSSLETYLASPIWVHGDVFGTLNFTSLKPRGRPFDEVDIEILDLMARGIGQVIERDEAQQARNAALQKMRESNELFESAFEFAAIGMALVGTDGQWLRVNPAVCSILGYSEDELFRTDFQSITHPDDLDKDLDYLREMLAGKRTSYRMEKRYFHKRGHEIWAVLNVSLVWNEDGSPRYFVSQIHEITEKKRAEADLIHKQRELEAMNERLENLATTDPLTGVMNRRALDERMEEELVRASRTHQSLSFLLLDVDHFKRFNDSYGHPAGDRALELVAATLESVARETDFVGRFGGEEFAILLPHTDTAGAATVAERIRQGIAGIESLEAPITVSIGAVTLDPALSGTERRTASDLLSQADKSLYQAKTDGRNRCCQAETIW